ncbi:protein NUCLEOLAR COMPLEX ASSOCIATED 4-like [Eucalyptus grandis]|uniref:protein NUCLEOLAR COMPLEX ASSOCIATED 4-like n=1 Tax=Eucalyptus grandis TaxID=71139 RepID=UPI00192EC72F|nr:protein NUCLEOLAR COMPLEX ASSOCIATED 4-like [Eucalyptus grandis]
MFCDLLKKSYDIVGVVSVMALSSLFILMTQHGLDYPYYYEKLLVSCLRSPVLPAYLAALVVVAPILNLFQWHPSINCLVHREDGESEAKDDMKEQIVGNRNDSTGINLPKKRGFDLFHDASGPSKSLKPEVDLKEKSMNLLYILLVNLLPFNIFLVFSATKIAKKIKLMFTKSWISFLRLPLPLDAYKEVLVSLHQTVIPQLSNPVMFCDFLTRSYDIGGVVSVMALSSVFILMTQHGLEYHSFYEKLLVSCLKSTLLPAYLAAAKKLSRLALSVLPVGALFIIASSCNLLQWHPSIPVWTYFYFLLDINHAAHALCIFPNVELRKPPPNSTFNM